MNPHGKRPRHAVLRNGLKILVYLCDHRFGGTVADLADEIGVSKREVLRYLAAFDEAGIPLERNRRRGCRAFPIRLRDRRWLAEKLGVI